MHDLSIYGQELEGETPRVGIAVLHAASLMWDVPRPAEEQFSITARQRELIADRATADGVLIAAEVVDVDSDPSTALDLPEAATLSGHEE